MADDTDSRGRLTAIEVDAPEPGPIHAYMDEERRVAVRDLLAGNTFRPGGRDGAFALKLSVADERLVFEVDEDGAPVTRFTVSLRPLRRVIKDYFMICDSYYEALRSSQPAQIETIDMGRRGVHNDGAEALGDQLEGEVETDFETARRLFTLVCALRVRA